MDRYLVALLRGASFNRPALAKLIKNDLAFITKDYLGTEILLKNFMPWKEFKVLYDKDPQSAKIFASNGENIEVLSKAGFKWKNFKELYNNDRTQAQMLLNNENTISK